ncbi:hypothetical protein [Gimesia chilikensis]|uniref:Lipoprotein n=1 Tax=Gimesia chilikensis TaxID=2605989 RepID=A0A517PSZ1_9PLAN|nr:hypothetical protein [Gimesia chilikensis]QDT22495.1 hypothetical protein HG66A1_43030 [Gimesia chilikensis]
MKKQRLIRIMASIVVLLCLATFSGCGHESVSLADNVDSERHDDKIDRKYRSPEAKAILSALQADNQISSKLNLTENTKTEAMIEYLVVSMKDVDVSECPAKFCNAYSEHIAAWQRVLRIVHEYSDDIPTVQEWLKVTALHGTEPRTDLEREVFAAFDDVDSTFEICKSIAAEYDIKRSEFDPKD